MLNNIFQGIGFGIGVGIVYIVYYIIVQVYNYKVTQNYYIQAKKLADKKRKMGIVPIEKPEDLNYGKDKFSL